MALTLSTKPWSSYTEADYTIEQWHAACLIHQHTGPPTSKSDCKLPVKTPEGALNRDGCIAAGGALAGARSPLKASAGEKQSAARALIRYYGQFNMKPTPMMMSLAHFDISDFLAHYGVLGMKWGHRKSEESGGSSGGTSGLKRVGRGVDNIAFEALANSDWVHEDILEGAATKLRNEDLPRIEAKHAASGGSKLKTRILHPLSKEAKAYRADVKQAYLKRLEEAANSQTNIQGTRQYTLSENGVPNTSQYFWEVSTREVTHAASASRRVHPVFNQEGFIVDIKPVKDDIAQAALLGKNFIAHYGVLGMKWGHRRAESGGVSVDVKSTPAGTRVITRGGAHLPAHPDAVAARVVEQKLKKSGKNSVSNEELQKLALRLNLERQVSRLKDSDVKPGEKFVKSIVTDIGNQQIREYANKTVTKGIKMLLKEVRKKVRGKR